MELRELTTAGVLVAVSTQYNEEFSRLDAGRFFFNYNIWITNQNDFPVQLLRRHWIIKDSLSVSYEVNGEGVVGQQPEILPGQNYAYSSGCELFSEIGSMHGYYTFKNLLSNKEFDVQIPQFTLFYPGRLN